MGQKSKIFKIPLRIEQKTLKTARKSSLSKIVHIFANVAIKRQVKVFQLPLEMNSTVIPSVVRINIVRQTRDRKTIFF